MALPLDPADYYDFFPPANHAPGDIWVNLPTFGVLTRSHVPGLVLTPACDLSNRKAETITYVPVLPVSVFLVSRSMVPEIKRAVEGQMEAAQIRGLLSISDGFEVPSAGELDSALQLLAEERERPRASSRFLSAIDRASCGLRLMRMLIATEERGLCLEDLETLVGTKAFTETIRRIITNARPEIHFLPADGQKPEWTALHEHSVALFRFPLTLPIDVLDIAQSVSEDDWSTATRRMRASFPCVDALPSRPMKRLRLHERFGSDLLTRYTGMFGRLGSPDFTPETVTRFLAEIQEKK